MMSMIISAMITYMSISIIIIIIIIIITTSIIIETSVSG